MSELLSVENLHTQFDSYDGAVRAVDGATFTVDEGEIVGIVGESGCGKSVTARSIVGLEDPGEVVAGSIELAGTEVTTASERQLRRLRGETVSMAFQDPTETLNPVFDVGEQIAEALKVHDDDRQRLREYLHAPLFGNRSDWAAKRERAVELMEQVGIASPEDRVDAYPHELSGGMRQRAGLAIALASEPELLIADEPTTALDTTTQAGILDLLRRLNRERGLAVLLITHDLGVVAELCDRVVVMYAGEVMETGPTDRVLADPRHPYTRALLSCLTQTAEPKTRLPTIEGTVPERHGETSGCPFAPRCEHATDRCRRGDVPVVDLGEGRAACGEPIALESGSTIEQEPTEIGAESDRRDRSTDDATAQRPRVELETVSKRYALDDGLLDRVLGDTRTLGAVEDVSLEIGAGEVLGLVGESGSGKSTLAGLVTGLEAPTAGTVRFDGEAVGPAADRDPETLADVGVVFQNPRSSLNPRLTAAEAVAEPLRTHGWPERDRADRVASLLERVGLSEDHTEKYPHELSGGQVQRVAIARALALDPDLLVLDEPVSALDASVQARILNLLLELRADLELTYLLISHDLDVIEHVADRIAVMYLGELVEVGSAAQLFDRPSHPYTRALLDAIPSLDPTDEPCPTLGGEIPSPADPPGGCSFHTRCPAAEPECERDEPSVRAVGDARSKCHFAEAIAEQNANADGDADDVPETPNPR
ncbi:ABC transporter ATP-binding protein [Natronococcus occultus]|uniref:Oligopeptide/dipeptide ABC transporter, ATP-binding protein n=1 Tax=Natronococcus occultus SP4 TaxID=694430 RepID=L0K5Q1_9EURY|nr:ABC transporter ATP-binding protein [Natronococcus occultus]AGB39448.1 oligopeptide/dipeptide ABC transporter, ATP-binding protein [Natronococcus occultus SP4]